MQIMILIIFIALLLPGLAGAFLPFPGVAYMFTITLIFGLINHFQFLTWQNVIILAVILALSTLVDIFSGVIGAKYGGADKKSIYAGMLGMLAGTFLLPPFGGLIGIFVAVLIWEMTVHPNHRKAIKAAGASLLGSVAGIVINLFISILFIVLFVIFALK